MIYLKIINQYSKYIIKHITWFYSWINFKKKYKNKLIN